MSKNRRLLLVTGIPGTGKTSIGDFLQSEHGFLHVNREIHQPPEFSKDPSNFLSNNQKDVVATWGFRPKEQEDIDGVEHLLSLGFKGVWLDGHRPWALNHFLRSKPHMEWSFYLQMFNVETGGIPARLHFPTVNPFKDDGKFREKSEIAKELLGLYWN